MRDSAVRIDEHSGMVSGITRRQLLAQLAALGVGSGQTVATRGVKPSPRGKPSGIPFLAHFEDIGRSAGLTAPTVYGAFGKKENVLEGVGCGVAAFDFD